MQFGNSKLLDMSGGRMPLIGWRSLPAVDRETP